MPFKSPEAPKCPKCDRSVYAAEEKVAGGYKWHKVCFKCSMCNKLLDSTTCTEHEKQLFCKTCYGRRYGPKGVGFGQGAGALSMDIGEQFGNTVHQTNGHSKHNDNIIIAPAGQGCPRCSGFVYHADQVFSKGRAWHKGCFKCSVCHRSLDSRIACDGPDNDVYCNECFSKIETDCIHCGHRCWRTNVPCPMGLRHQPKRKTFILDENQVGRLMNEADHGMGALYIIIDALRNRTKDQEEFENSGCYRKTYGLKGYGFGQGGPALLCSDLGESQQATPLTSKFIDTTTIPAKPGEGCPRCGGRVFHAEQMFSKGKTYHKKCFACGNCKKPLDSVLCCDAPDGDIYCKGCYAKNFGAKGYGFGCGAGFLQCSDVESAGNDRPILNVDTTTIQGGKDSCPRCGGSVFHAERMLSKNNVFHKPCFSCFDCKRPLDSTLCCDAPNNEIFCKLCYAKNFGPKGYGYGGSGSMPALLAGEPGQFADERIQVDFLPDNRSKCVDGKGCLRCGFSVFEAEKLIAAGRSWHKRCFTCSVCNRHLDSTTVNDGPDGDIYCRADYNSRFGMKGYGFGQGAGTLMSDGSDSRNIRISAESAFILP